MKKKQNLWKKKKTEKLDIQKSNKHTHTHTNTQYIKKIKKKANYTRKIDEFMISILFFLFNLNEISI